jgi:hypothetical protein
LSSIDQFEKDTLITTYCVGASVAPKTQSPAAILGRWLVADHLAVFYLMKGDPARFDVKGKVTDIQAF